MKTQTQYKLSFFETLTMAAGFTIGSGIVTQTGLAIGMTGRSVSLAFLASSFLFLIAFRPIFIMSTLLPRTSAAYSYARELVGEEAGGLYCYTYFLGRFTIAIFGISFAQYLASILNVFHHPILTKAAAISLLTIFYIINLYGIQCAAKFQNIMFFVLLAGLLSYIIYGMGKILPGYLSFDTFFTHGSHGFYSATSLLFFAVGGSYIITDFAPTIKNSAKVITKIIYLVTFGICLLYMLLGMVSSGVLPVSQASGQPLTLVAEMIFPNSGLLLFFIVGACIGALITTLNSSFIWYSNSLIHACKEGWFPRNWADLNKRGVPYKLMTIFYLFGLIPTLLGVNLQIISKTAIGLTILSTCIPMAGILKLPSKYPSEWKSSRYFKRYPPWRIRVMVILTYLIMLTQVYALFAGNPAVVNVILLLFLAGIITYLLSRYRKRIHSV